MLASKTRAGLVFSSLLIVGSLAFPSGAGAAFSYIRSFGTQVTPISQSEQPVFVYNDQNTADQYANLCKASDQFGFPDAPPRAFKDASGNAQLIISSAEDTLPGHFTTPQDHSHRMIGSDLNHVREETPCHVIYNSDNRSDPGSFDNWEWLTAPYVASDGTVYSLVHNEYHGWEHTTDMPPECMTSSFTVNCWYNAITFARSTDGGSHYADYPDPTTPSGNRVATFPYRYSPNTGPEGYFQPSNILHTQRPYGPVRGDDTPYYYALVRAENGTQCMNGSCMPPIYSAQQRGDCLIRTSDLSNPASWKAWDGSGFNVSFINPYTDMTSPPTQHVCTPVGSPTSAGGMTGSLTYNTYLKRYLLVDFNNNPNGNGVYYSLSNDLINWTPRQLLVKTDQSPFDPSTPLDCSGAKQEPIADPAVLDPNSSDTNFSTTGQVNDLYFVVFHLLSNSGGCFTGVNRDLDKVTFRFQFNATPRSATGMYVGCPSSFDTSTSITNFAASSDFDYTGARFSYKASTANGESASYAEFNRDGEPDPACELSGVTSRAPLTFGAGDHVLYGGAFLFPSSFWNLTANVTLLKLSDPSTPGWAGAFTIGPDHIVHFTTSNGSTTTEILKDSSGRPGIPLTQQSGCFHLLQAFQTLGPTMGTAENYVYIDGLLWTFAPTINYYGTPYRTIRAGIVDRTATGPGPFLYTDGVAIDNSLTNKPPYLGCGH